MMVGLALSYDTESYAGGSVATGRVSNVVQIKGVDQKKKDTQVLLVGG
jgi:hypothetical protein